MISSSVSASKANTLRLFEPPSLQIASSTQSTYAQLFYASSSIRSLSAIRRLHRRLSNSLVLTDVILHIHILNAYGKCRSLDDALQLFNTMPERNLVSWTSVISGLSQNHREREAVELYLGMLQSGFLPDQFALGSVVGARSCLLNIHFKGPFDLHKGKSYKPKVNTEQQQSCNDNSEKMKSQNRSITNIDAPVKKRKIEAVQTQDTTEKKEESLPSMEQYLTPSASQHHAMMKARFADTIINAQRKLLDGDTVKMEALIKKCKPENKTHNRRNDSKQSLVVVSDLLSKSMLFGEKDRVEAAKKQCVTETEAINIGFVVRTHKMLTRIKQYYQNFSTSFISQQCTNDFIISLCKQGQYPEALEAAFSSDCVFYPSTYAKLFYASSSIRSLTAIRRLHRRLSNSLVLTDVILHNHILNAYGKCRSLDDALQLFDTMPERNLVSWTSVISGLSQNHREREAVELYLSMLQSGFLPDQFALGSVVRACSGLLDIELGRQLHCHTIKMDHGRDRIVQNALVTMYSRSDGIRDASIVFERIADKDLVSWGSMIAALAQKGHEFEALCLFKQMLDIGVDRPNEFHFGSLFSACGIISRLDQGEQLHGLCVKFGLETDNFAGCSLSDMYARCGRLDHARKAFFSDWKS
ncbi:putative pentatricopeptide repeat-containing protein At3g47840 [Dioscorea cayenensis subsp. rotundata]|uniref:Pentatricopeptide repeat-containing protein At3g47840 n=1 Tax=Dioscorea cayennensis subsp. rotundata TaxID=55577 RepID=A0AB40CJX2_DIOCR|nr:putative pentatricopeptide repeat-containing protein At3g47840 [Dioscorea cayenensis subsp. rotundata]